jgi:multidrug transporter EmrE-like cation transporter
MTDYAMDEILLKSVFTVIAGIIIFNEQISVRELFGYIIMFTEILLLKFQLKKKS